MLIVGIGALVVSLLGVAQIIRLWRSEATRAHLIFGTLLSLVFTALLGLFGVSQIAIAQDIKRQDHAGELLKEGGGLVEKVRALGEKARSREQAVLFPRADTGWSPAAPCCQRGGDRQCSTAASDWTGAPWDQLGFHGNGEGDPLQYWYTSDGERAFVKVRVDTDCDGRYSTAHFELTWNPKERRIHVEDGGGESEFGK